MAKPKRKIDRSIVLKRTCPRCGGTGKDPDNKSHRCYSCGGKGIVYIQR